MNRYGSATAQDLYNIFIGSGALVMYDHWELRDNEDDTRVSDGWYVIVGIENDMTGILERRLHADLLWVAILACGTFKVPGVDSTVADKCARIANGTPLDEIEIHPADADIVMQVALLGRVHHRTPGVRT